jgi:hypothetical protein
LCNFVTLDLIGLFLYLLDSVCNFVKIDMIGSFLYLLDSLCNFVTLDLIGLFLYFIDSVYNIWLDYFVVFQIVCVIVIQYERRKAVYSSGFLLIFWLLLSVAGILIFQSVVRTALRMVCFSGSFCQ